eukprot:1151760-Pelagomonas_calceolata.AAC.10
MSTSTASALSKILHGYFEQRAFWVCMYCMEGRVQLNTVPKGAGFTKDSAGLHLKEQELDWEREELMMSTRLIQLLAFVGFHPDYAKNYFVSGAGEMAAYAEDCVFADPFVAFPAILFLPALAGTKRFKQNVSNLGGQMCVTCRDNQQMLLVGCGGGVFLMASSVVGINEQSWMSVDRIAKAHQILACDAFGDHLLHALVLSMPPQGVM